MGDKHKVIGDRLRIRAHQATARKQRSVSPQGKREAAWRAVPEQSVNHLREFCFRHHLAFAELNEVRQISGTEGSVAEMPARSKLLTAYCNGNQVSLCSKTSSCDVLEGV